MMLKYHRVVLNQPEPYTKSLVRVDVDKHLRHKVTLDGGYKDQLWSIINDLNELFFIGSSYLESTRIELA